MDEEWVEKEVNRHLWMQHGDMLQFTREELERWVRSPGYKKQTEVLEKSAEERGRLVLEARARAEQRAKELGVEDWSPFYVEERENQLRQLDLKEKGPGF